MRQGKSTGPLMSAGNGWEAIKINMRGPPPHIWTSHSSHLYHPSVHCTDIPFQSKEITLSVSGEVALSYNHLVSVWRSVSLICNNFFSVWRSVSLLLSLCQCLEMWLSPIITLSVSGEVSLSYNHFVSVLRSGSLL